MEGNIQKYIGLLRAVDTGSFTRAAEQLNYTQSGVSRMISDIEKEWNVVLLERNKGGIRLTGDGETLIPFVRTLAESYETLMSHVNEINGINSGTLRLGAFPGMGAEQKADIIGGFRQLYPEVDFEIVGEERGDTEELILSGRVEGAFVKLPSHPDLETVFLDQARLLAVLPHGHRLAEETKVPAALLCEDDFLLYKDSARSETEELLERCGLVPKTCIVTGDCGTVLTMTERGLGVSILPEYMLGRAGSYGIEVRELDIPAYINVGFAVKNRKNASNIMKKFVDYLETR